MNIFYEIGKKINSEKKNRVIEVTYFNTTKNNGAGIEVHSTSHRVHNRFRLFKDFFLHKGIEIS